MIHLGSPFAFQLLTQKCCLWGWKKNRRSKYIIPCACVKKDLFVKYARKERVGGHYLPLLKTLLEGNPFARTFQSVYYDSWGRIQVYQRYISLTNFFTHKVMFLHSGSAFAAFISRGVTKMHSES